MIFRFFSGSDTPANLSKTFCSVCFNDVQTKLATKHLHNLICFPFTKKTVVYKDTNQLIADCFLRRTPTTEESTPPERPRRHVCLRQFHGFFFDLHVNEVVHGPITFSPTDVQGKVTQDIITVNRVTNLRVELDPVDFLIRIFNGCKRTVSRSTSADKVSWNFCNSIPVAHQDQLFVWCVRKKTEDSVKVSSD